MHVVLQQLSNDLARRNKKSTLDKPFDYRLYEKHLSSDCVNSLRELSADGRVWAWGAKREREHQFLKMPPRNTLVLFRSGRFIIGNGAIAATTESERLGRILWQPDPKTDESWPLIYFLVRYNAKRLSASFINGHLRYKPTYNWQGMISAEMPDTENSKVWFLKQLGLSASTDALE